MTNKAHEYVRTENEQKTVFEGEVAPEQARFTLARTAIKYAQKFQIQRVANELGRKIW